MLVPLGLCSLLGSITVLCASAFVQFIGRLIGAADFDQLRTPAFYLVAAVLVAPGVLQARPPPPSAASSSIQVRPLRLRRCTSCRRPCTTTTQPRWYLSTT